MICKSCGKQIDADSKYCQYCGAEQDGILKCHKEHYYSSEIKSLSWYEYNKLMADELNENGFECYVDPLNEGRFVVYKPDLHSPTYPLVNLLSRKIQLDFLIQKDSSIMADVRNAEKISGLTTSVNIHTQTAHIKVSPTIFAKTVIGKGCTCH